MLPFPGVLYDQATYPFNPEKRKAAKEANRQLRKVRPAMPVLNNKRFFGKWETCCALSFFPEIRQLLPNTLPLTPLNLELMLEQWKSIYAKSEYGSYGWGVLRLQKEGEKITCHNGGERLRWHISEGIVSLYRFLREKLGSGGVLQERVPLAWLGDKIFDMRLLAQKDGSGEWRLTCISLRLAHAEAVATNVALGHKKLF